MHDIQRSSAELYADDVEAIAVSRMMKPTDPVTRCPRQLALFSPVDGAQWTPETFRHPRLHLDEHHQPGSARFRRPFDDKIDITMTASKPTLYNLPPFARQPALRDPLATLAKNLTCR